MGYSLFNKNTFDALLKGVFLCLLYKLVLSGRQLWESKWFLVSLCPWPFKKGSNLIRLRDIDSIFCKMKTRSEHLNTKICSDGGKKLSKTFFCTWIFQGGGGCLHHNNKQSENIFKLSTLSYPILAHPLINKHYFVVTPFLTPSNPFT